jgi:uncharacterized membrane protein YcaP (DUF421 family)
VSAGTVRRVDLLEIAGRSLVVYVVVLGLLRLGGRREVGQLTPFDLVFILLVANAVQNAMVGPDTTLAGGVVAAVMLFAANYGVAKLRLRSPRFRELVEGGPVVLVQHGEWVPGVLEREALTQDEVLAALREHGEVDDLSHVELAVLESDGSISIVPRSANVHRSRRRLRHRRQP